MVQSQIEKAHLALTNTGKDLAREIGWIEKRVNGIELKIDRDCEHILALYAPVAVDLRLVLALLKINTNPERVGEAADSVARYLLKLERVADHAKNIAEEIIFYLEAKVLKHRE